MPIVNMNDMLHHAYLNGYAVGSFEVVNLDVLKGIMAAAERAHAPVVLSLSESNFKHSDIELLMPAIEAAARRAYVPVAIHLDLCTGLQSAISAINLGCNGVKVVSRQENFDIASDVVKMAHGCGVPVEGKLQEKLSSVPETEGVDTESYRVKHTYSAPEEMSRYVENTGLDLLDVSLEIVDDSTETQPQLNYNRLKQINETLAIPLASQAGMMHADDQFRQLITNGVAKINFSSDLADFSGEFRRLDDYKSMSENIISIVASQTEHYMQLLKSTSRAADMLAQCQPWMPVEHLIIYNVQGLNKNEIKSMISEGQRVLASIPGVREVFAGEAVKVDASYQYTWLVRFCHSSVIDSYRDHPDHIDFADKLFRPVAGERISIDFQTIESD